MEYVPLSLVRQHRPAGFQSTLPGRMATRTFSQELLQNAGTRRSTGYFCTGYVRTEYGATRTYVRKVPLYRSGHLTAPSPPLMLWIPP